MRLCSLPGFWFLLRVHGAGDKLGYELTLQTPEGLAGLHILISLILDPDASAGSQWPAKVKSDGERSSPQLGLSLGWQDPAARRGLVLPGSPLREAAKAQAPALPGWPLTAVALGKPFPLGLGAPSVNWGHSHTPLGM